MKRLSCGILCLTVTVTLFSQQLSSWKTTNYASSPTASRLNDGFFLSANLGWAVNGIGQIHRTTNGGISWQKQFDKTNYTHFRSVGFFDSLNGYAGALGFGDANNTAAKDTVILYKTTNGGALWIPEHQLTSGTIKRGFCGMHVFNDSIIYAVGRVRGPAWFYKTTDRGKTWTAKEMNQYAAGLIDVYFFNKDTGMTVGLTNITHEQSSGIILFTTNGGETWTQRFVTSRNNEWCWKISFPSRTIGYVSLQRNGNVAPVFILKTTDGGTTWQQKQFSSTGYFVQGIGFINETLGWIGGTTLSPYQTTDGGNTWAPLTIGNQLNRFRKVNDSIAYFFGASVFKYSSGTSLGATKEKIAVPENSLLETNYPNPFNPQTTIEFKIPEDGFTTLLIYDSKGAWVRTLVNGIMNKGNYTLTWNGRNEADEEAASGVYLYKLQTKNYSETKKMALVR